MIGGITPTTNITDAQTATPFSGVTFTNPDVGKTYTLTVTLNNSNNGAWSNLSGGTYNSGTGVYTLAGVALTAAQSAVQGLVFLPTPIQVQPGQTVGTNCYLAITDGIQSAYNGSTTVITTAAHMPTAIGGTTSTTNITDEQTATPFSGVTLTNPDVGVIYSLTVTLANAGNGTLSNLGGRRCSGGVYTLATVTLAAAQTALQ